jgi:hypothetical protein
MHKMTNQDRVDSEILSTALRRGAKLTIVCTNFPQQFVTEARRPAWQKRVKTSII